MMFGLREHFAYFQCSRCSCLQIADIPEDMSRFYPPSYFSFTGPSRTIRSGGGLRRLLGQWRDEAAVLRAGFLGRLLYLQVPNPELRQVSDRHFPGDILSLARVTPRSKVLDVGCGQGDLLLALWKAGFRHLMGVDRFIDGDIVYSTELRILKGTVADCPGEWDLVMLHHSLEHMEDQVTTLSDARRLLSPRGHVLVRVPVVSSEAWDLYGTDWAQLDAPRHFFLHSERSLRLAAELAGLRVVRVIYDSGAFQFWASEQYRRGIPLLSSESFGMDPTQSLFSSAQIADFEAKARELNAEARGDQAAFLLALPGVPAE